jgi:hypothetical protein
MKLEVASEDWRDKSGNKFFCCKRLLKRIRNCRRPFWHIFTPWPDFLSWNKVLYKMSVRNCQSSFWINNTQENGV